jgi:hypothetical protein
VCSRRGHPRRHRLGAADWLPVGVATDGAGLRQWCHLLAPPSRLPRGRRLGEVAHQAAELVRGRGCHRLVHGQRRFPQHARQQRGGQTGPNPVDRGQTGSKYHLVVVRNGIPFAVRLSAANAHDAKQLLPLVLVIPPIIGPCGTPGRPHKRAVKLHSDKAYDASTTLASMAPPTDRPVAEPGTDCG